MAIAVALGETPNDMPITIYSDSTAAIAKVSRKNQRPSKPKKQCMYSSPLDWVCAVARQKMQDRTAPTTIKWIEGNEEDESVDHFLKCSSQKTGDDFVLALREKFNSPAKENSEFGLDAGVANALAELPLVENVHKGMLRSWYTSIGRVHKSLYRTGLKPPPRNTWMTAVLRAGFQALYDTCWRI